ncbi:MAG: Nuclease family protein [Rhodospirillales bacterium]|nr:Nuclease family protein [Rhodospirillales bacterium]
MSKTYIASALIFGAFCGILIPSQAFAWNEEGHRIVALIADHYLDPAVKQKIETMLSADTDTLTQHDIASEAIWADTHRDLDRKKAQARFAVTDTWHSLAIELSHPDIDAACGGHPPLPKGTPASQGPAACSLDKIRQFTAELASKGVPAPEKLLALKYLLNLVGDLHQPLYVSDDHNGGGDQLRVVGGGADRGTLRHYWDADFLDFLGDDPKAIADDLADGIRQSKTFEKMSEGSPKDWAEEAFGLAREHAYGKLPAKKPDGSYELPPDYVTDAIETMRLQLARAGVRLAAVLNHALGAND